MITLYYNNIIVTCCLCYNISVLILHNIILYTIIIIYIIMSCMYAFLFTEYVLVDCSAHHSSHTSTYNRCRDVVILVKLDIYVLYNSTIILCIH